jgi:BirA family biotin operon repressor/biotin-[acetyl-CoA-carboxylase] ligase
MSLYSELDVQKIEAEVDACLVGSKIIIVNEVDSTNELAKSYVENHPPGRSWHSPPGAGIYLSVLLKPDIEVIQLSPMTLMTGVAVANAVNSFQPLSVDLKWPNDILLNGKKLGGILCELVPFKEKFWVVLGIGVNVNHEADHFPLELSEIATSLYLQNGKYFDRTQLVISILKNLNHRYLSFLSEGIQPIIEDWTDLTKMIGKPVQMTQGGQSIEGVALGLDDQGSIILELQNGELKTFNSGEVSLHKS